MRTAPYMHSGLWLVCLLVCLSIPFASSAVRASEKQLAKGSRPRIGLALGGGGTRGVAHVGVLQVLEKEGIPIDYISGTSMGAIVGGLYAAGLSPAGIDTLFRNRSMIRSYDTVPIPLRLALVPVFFLPHMFGHHPYDGLYKGNKFAHYIDSAVDESRRNIENLKIPFAAIATDLLAGKPEAITTGDLGRALQASSAIPQLRRPVPLQGKLYVDGGVLMNLPVEQCRQMGADIVIGVNVDERLETVPAERFRKIGSVAMRCLNMHLAEIDEPQVSQADILIHPQVNGIRILSRRIEDMDAALIEGQKAADAALPAIRQEIERKSSEMSAGNQSSETR